MSFKSAWRIAVITIFLTVVFVVTLLGIKFLTVDFLTFTYYGALLSLRKNIQLYLAIRNNSLMMNICRAPIISRLIFTYPDNEETIVKAGRLHAPFDKFRSRLQNDLDLDDITWEAIENWSLDNITLTGSLTAPVFGLKLEEVTKLGESLLAQTRPLKSVYFVLNDATDIKMWDHLQSLTRDLNKKSREKSRDFQTRFDVLIADPAYYEAMLEPEEGKRNAMRMGFEKIIAEGADVTFNVDGDTYLDPSAIANAMQVLSQDSEVVCLTGDVRLSNPDFNFLTAITGVRYFNAFNVERAAQSYYGQMTVLSGPFMAIRTKNLAEILDEWHGQTFMGAQCTYGDDRHLTTLCLARGWKAVFVPECIVWTDAPTTYFRWIMQQLRWSRSAKRENYILAINGTLNKLSWFVLGDLVYLTFFPFIVLGVVLSVIYRSIDVALSQGFLGGIEVALPYIITVIVVNLVYNSGYGLFVRRDKKFLLSPLYVIPWFVFLIPVNLYAYLTVSDTGWTGRTSDGVS